MKLFLIVVFVEYLRDDSEIILRAFSFLSTSKDNYSAICGDDNEHKLVLPEIVDKVVFDLHRLDQLGHLRLGLYLLLYVLVQGTQCLTVGLVRDL